MIFDLDINENDVLNPSLKSSEIILNVMEEADRRGQSGTLALSVERILTPLPAANLPRLEKLSPESPPNLLRQYLISNYTLAELERMTQRLEIDWQELGSEGKKTRVRRLLLYLKRRNRLPDLLDQMRQMALDDEAAVKPSAAP